MTRDRRKRDEKKDEDELIGQGTGSGSCPVIVVGIGASVDGLKSLQQLFSKMAPGYGVAFVLIQHLDPSQENLDLRLLMDRTALTVVEATDGMPVVADRIHVIPPNHFLNITESRLTLQGPVYCNSLLMPIDHFFCSLASDQRQRGCGILLSGTGGDGTLGLSEIKAAGGRTLAEDPGNVEFHEISQSAIAAGVVDQVLPARAMAEAIIALAKQVIAETRGEPGESPEFDANLRAVLDILRQKVGHDFRGYKPNTLVRRIRRRMTLGKAETFGDYARFLEDHPEEIGLLKKDLLIGVTEFFRQPQAWEVLAEKMIASLVENAQPGSEIRVWVPGCSTGKEAYSLAMLLAEGVEKSGKKVVIQIFATDSDATALATARSGTYPEEEIRENVSTERLKRFFTRKDGRYQVIKKIREQIVFAPQNLTSDPPFSRLDLISCRNLLIYLDQEVQKKIIALFHFALREGGYLFLGTAETVGEREDLFEPVSKKWRIYRRIGVGRPVGVDIPVRPTGKPLPAAGTISTAASPFRMSLASMAQQVLLDRFAPACVVIDRKLQVLYVHGVVEDYLTFPTGELTTHVVDMAREGLRARLRAAIGKCLEVGKFVSVTARVRRGEKSVPVKATVSPLRYPGEAAGLLLIAFEDYRVSAAKSRSRGKEGSGARQIEDELKVTREELQSTIEQLEISNDQLKASNEEVTAANEELQSANEEMETSKEELQSLNEELNTINARLQEKVEELEDTNNDVVNLLSSTSIATVFLDKDLRVRSYTPASTRLLSLIPSDVGRSIADVLRRFADEALLDDARRVLGDLAPLSKEVQADDGRWYIRRVTPYRTQDDRIEGVVITFVDVSDLKQTEESLRQSEERFRLLVEGVRDCAILMLDECGCVASWNVGAERIKGWTAPEIIGQHFSRLYPPELVEQGLPQRELEIAAATGQYHEEGQRLRKDGSRFWADVTITALRHPDGRLRGFAKLTRDITERKRIEDALREVHERAQWLARFPEQNPNPIIRVSADGTVLYCNPASTKLHGWACEVGQLLQDQLLPLVGRAMAEGREVQQDVQLGESFYIVWIAPFPEEGYANVYGRNITGRKQAEDALRESEQRLKRAQEIAHLGSWELDLVNNRLTWSDEVYRIFGLQPQAFGATYEAFLEAVHPDDRAAVDAAYSGSLREGRDTYEIEHRVVRKSTGEIRIVHEKCEHFRDAAGRIIRSVGMVHDITERKRAEQSLSDSEARFKLLSDTASRLLETDHPQGIVDELCREVMAHLDCHVFFNFLVDEEAGRLHLNACSGVPEEEARKLEWLDYGAAVSGCVARDGAGMVGENITTTPDPRTELVKSYGIQAYVCNQLMVQGRLIGTLSFGTRTRPHFFLEELALMRAVTDHVATAMERMRLIEQLRRSRDELEARVEKRTAELTKANEALRDLSSKLLSAQEEERKRIAAEIHDTIGSSLSAVKFKMEGTLRQVGETTPAATESLKALISVVQESIDECRRIQMDLRPSMLDDLGLLTTLSWFFRRFQTIYSGIRIEKEIEIEEGDVPTALKIVVYRVTQEAMNNIAKHSRADLVRLFFRKVDGRMELIIQDNGQGFNPERVLSVEGTRRGLGLSSMRERTELSGGSFVIESTEGEGTIIHASWPLPQK